MTATASPETIADRDARSIVVTRLFDAPRELLFDVFTDPAHVSQWWGPRGFTTTTQQHDLRPGGVWRFVMHGPDGVDYKNKVVYRDIVKPERLAYAHCGEDDTADITFEVIVTFEEAGGQTRLTMRSVFPSAAARNHVVEEFGAIEGAHHTLDRLGEQLARITAKPFVIARSFDAPRELVWRVWTESEHLLQWFGPKGMAMVHANNDLRPGGVFHYMLSTANGANEMWARWVYREITPPRRLVFVSSFSDAEGNVTRAPFASDWPLEMLTTVTFDEHDGRTTVTLETLALTATEAQRKTFVEGHASMNGGWSGTFEQLESYLAEVAS